MGDNETKTKYEEVIENLEIDWENYIDEEDDILQTKKYWQATEVLHCKLEHLLEFLEYEVADAGFDFDDHIDTIKMVQSLLETLDDKGVRK